MTTFLSDHTNQTEALASIADSLAAISVCAQWATVTLIAVTIARFALWLTTPQNN